jgi:hypothetical protein
VVQEEAVYTEVNMEKPVKIAAVTYPKRDALPLLLSSNS